MRRALLTRPFMWIAVRTAPPLYMAYMRLVFATSRLDFADAEARLNDVHKYGGVVVIFWHEEVFAAPFSYYKLGVRGHTLINRSDVGELITRIAERCALIAFRGGTSSRRSRRRSHVFRDMIDHMNRNQDVVYGVAVDGSQGPAYRVKRGPVVIARECDKPIALSRLWFSRSLRLPTWDRTAVPLPFGRIRIRCRGPYFPPEDARTKAGLERFRLRLEHDLIELAGESYRALGQPLPRSLERAGHGAAPPRS
jgi:lysophospholipid acyltransferase (LPLAT)-like uncharacterized protein